MKTIEIEYDEVIEITTNATLYELDKDDSLQVWIPVKSEVSHDRENKKFVITMNMAKMKKLI